MADTRTKDYVKQLEWRIRIEEALERVRTHTMAMNASEELADMASVMFENLLDLFDIAPSFTRCVIVITHEDKGVNHVWSTDFAGRSLTSFRLLPLQEHPVQAAIYGAWKKDKKGYFSSSFDREAAQKYTTYLSQLPGFNRDSEMASVLKQMAENPERIPERFYLNMAFFSHGRVGMIMAQDLDPGQVDILKRFAHVFEQTYTRFLDLQKAEAFARETRQQASLDRVRGEIASMRNAEDLQRVTPLIWRELTAMDVPFFRCGVFIMDDHTATIQSFVTTPEGEHLASLSIPYDSTEITKKAVDAWRNNQVFTDQWDQQAFFKWTNAMIEQGHIESSQEIPDYDDPPESLSLHFVPFTQGMLYVGSNDALSKEQIKLVQSLADAFSVAYARYEDFQALEFKNAELATTLSHLETTQAQLIQSEKMASLGQLTAGIAHEIKNPLNFVNNFSHINRELINELEGALESVSPDAEELIAMLKLNEAKINEHGSRADRIVKSMMQHASGGSSETRAASVNALVEEYVNLAVHGIQSRENKFEVVVNRNYGEDVGEIVLMPQEFGRVLVNLFNNAFDTMLERKALSGQDYIPALGVETHLNDGAVLVKVRDNGMGIPIHLLKKIFEPFFTTKPAGTGTGLGLSLSYDIVTKGHSGTISVESEEGVGSTFIVSIPVRN